MSSKTAAARAVVTFQLDGLRCALPLEQVEEAVAMPAITPLPRVSEQLLGMINLHGLSCPVIDLRRALELPPKPIAPEQHLLIVRTGGRVLAAPADQVDGVLSAVPEALPVVRPQTALIQGVITTDDGSILLLDFDRTRQQLEAAAA
jgi:chemotaxis signal transduction protein